MNKTKFPFTRRLITRIYTHRSKCPLWENKRGCVECYKHFLEQSEHELNTRENDY